jgi:hypothetical protein
MRMLKNQLIHSPMLHRSVTLNRSAQRTHWRLQMHCHFLKDAR